MDRCALFVDAGYALADGAMAVHGTRRRDSVSWDHAGLLKLLAGLARDRTGLPVLRCYWYETAAEGRRTAEHDALAEMPGLKLRLVNALPGRREGIESQLRRDLVTLAKSGAISDAFIASANEHIAEIVAEVQDLGLRVVVLHIASDGGWTIPLPLRQECDDIVEISGVHLRSYVDLIRGAEPVGADEGYKSAQVGAVTHHGLPAAALAAPAAVYQVQDAMEQRQDSLAYGGSTGAHGLAESRITSGLNEARASADYQAEHAAKSAVNGVQSTGPAAPAAGPSYSAAPSYPGSAGRQGDPGSGYQNAASYQADAGVGYQDGVVAGYQSSSAASYQGSGGQGQGSQSGAGSSLDRGSQNGPAQNGADLLGAGQSGDAHSRAGLNGVAAGGDAHGSAGQVGVAPNGLPQNGGGRPGAAQNAFPGDPGLSGLTGVGYPQPGSYQRGPGQGGIEQNGSGQNGTASQNGAAYPATGQNGAAPFGYPGGQTGGIPGNIQSSYQPAGPGQQAPSQSMPGQQGMPSQQSMPGQQSLPGQQSMPGQSMPGQGGSGGPGQPQPGQQPHPGQVVPQAQSQNGQAQPGYQLGQDNGQNGSRGGALPGGFQPGAQPDPRSRDPYGSAMPQGPGRPDAQPSAPGQYGFGVPEMSYAPGQPPSQAPGQPGAQGQDPSQRPGYGQGPYQGHDGGMVVQPQYQVQQQSAAPLPAVRVQQPVAIALPDAVKAAHAEGFNFGESVGRDAPGLWLEAVLARKPRMPSDLEARLLQGSVLPIDSLLHDEVRHSLRRGFWDALESARR